MPLGLNQVLTSVVHARCASGLSLEFEFASKFEHIVAKLVTHAVGCADEFAVVLRLVMRREESQLYVTFVEPRDANPNEAHRYAIIPDFIDERFGDGDEHALVIGVRAKGGLCRATREVAEAQLDGDGVPRQSLVAQPSANFGAKVVDGVLEFLSGRQVFEERPLVTY